MRMLTFLILCTFMLGACRKEGPFPVKRQAATLDTPLSLQLDTNCMRAANVITVNGDWINDHFMLIFNEPLQSLSLMIRNPNGTTVYSSTTMQPVWTGFDAEFNGEPGPIPYLYTVQLTTMSGNELAVTKVLHVIHDIYNECVTADVAPLTGDQFEPRRCDHLYEPMDQICVE